MDSDRGLNNGDARDDCSIAKLGTHDELLAGNGYYAGLYRMQWQGGIAAD